MLRGLYALCSIFQGWKSRALQFSPFTAEPFFCLVKIAASVSENTSSRKMVGPEGFEPSTNGL